jgi:thiamine kinase-like enzyme
VNVEALLRSIPELESAPGLSWEDMPGGLTNRNFLVEAGSDRFVLRINRSAPGVDRAREARVLQVVSAAELAPEVIANRPAEGYLLTRFLEQPVWRPEDARDPTRLEDLARCLRRLHELPGAMPALNPEATLLEYLASEAVRSSTSFAALRHSVMELVRGIEDSGFQSIRSALCHHDLLHSNIIGDVRPMLIDWEYAAAGNPLLDLATFINYHDLDHDESAPLLEYYFGGRVSEFRDALAIAIRLSQALELLWLIQRNARGALPESAAGRLRRLLLVWT